MIRTGDILDNPITGETIRFVKAAADTGGAYVLIDVLVEPSGFVAALHVHPHQTEVFEILEGEITFKADGKTNRKGMPNPFRLAVIARAHFDDVRLPFPPAWLQKAGLLAGAPLGRLLGYEATYEPGDPGEASLAL